MQIIFSAAFCRLTIRELFISFAMYVLEILCLIETQFLSNQHQIRTTIMVDGYQSKMLCQEFRRRCFGPVIVLRSFFHSGARAHLLCR